MKKHPKHKARSWGSTSGNGTIAGWLIYPDQLPAMEKAIERAIVAFTIGDMFTATGRDLLAAIGLEAPQRKGTKL